MRMRVGKWHTVSAEWREEGDREFARQCLVFWVKPPNVLIQRLNSVERLGL